MTEEHILDYPEPDLDENEENLGFVPVGNGLWKQAVIDTENYDIRYFDPTDEEIDAVADQIEALE